MNPKDKDFLALQQKWYGKLAKSGFADIEDSEEYLKVWSSHYFKVRHNATLYAAKEEYYRLAGHFLHEYEFKSKLERAAWELHAEGVGIRDIVTRLRKKHFKTSPKPMNDIIRRLSAEMVKIHAS